MSAQLGGLRPGAVPAWARLAGTGAVSSRAARATNPDDGRRQAAASAAGGEGSGCRERVKGDGPHLHSLKPPRPPDPVLLGCGNRQRGSGKPYPPPRSVEDMAVLVTFSLSRRRCQGSHVVAGKEAVVTQAALHVFGDQQ